MNNKVIEKKDDKNPAYKHQRQYYQKNKDKLNAQRVLLNYKKKYKIIDTFDKMQKFKKHKKIYLQLHLLDKNLINDFLNLNK